MVRMGSKSNGRRVLCVIESGRSPRRPCAVFKFGAGVVGVLIFRLNSANLLTDLTERKPALLSRADRVDRGEMLKRLESWVGER